MFAKLGHLGLLSSATRTGVNQELQLYKEIATSWMQKLTGMSPGVTWCHLLLAKRRSGLAGEPAPRALGSGERSGFKFQV